MFTWLLYCDDPRKLNLDTFHTILAARLLSVVELDMQLARLLDSGRCVEFTCALITRCAGVEPVLCGRVDFWACYCTLSTMLARGNALGW